MSKSSNNNIIPLDHTLHGYQNGHTLIAASIDLPAEAKRQLLIMSDMSGASMQKGYEEYISGYPIKEIGCYAIAKTWYAPEMTRPGCVWTHTILIRFTDLINVTEYQSILSLFKRPQKEEEYRFYSEKLDLCGTKNQYGSLDEQDFSNDVVRRIVQSLYSDTNSPVFIESLNSNIYESLLLCIWLQQWPRLKRNFSFCSGSIGARSFNGKLLDLQVIPFSEALPKSNSVTFLNQIELSSSINCNDWCDIITDDLYHPSPLRKFINSFGADIKATKNAFRSLTIIYAKLTPRAEISCRDMIELLAKEFPESDEAVGLKIFALDEYAGDNITKTKISGLENVNVLYELATTEFYGAFDSVKLKLNEHIKELYDHHPEQVFEMFDRILDHNINPFGVEMLREIAKRTGALNFEVIKDKSNKLVQLFVHINPEIVYNDSFWNVSWDRQQENLNILFKSGVKENINWSRLFPVILERNIDIDFDSLRHVDFNIVDFLLSWQTSQKGGELSYRWKMFLQDRPQAVMEWLKKNGKVNTTAVRLLVGLLNPNSDIVISYGTDIWHKVLGMSKQDLNYSDEARLKAFTLALGFNNSDKGSRDLIVTSFETVYSAILNHNLDISSWLPLEAHTKPLVWWNDWDKARKLVIAIVGIFNENKWPAASFGKIFSDKKVAEKFLIHYRSI